MTVADWLSGFLKRHPHLSIRNPKATSRATASGLNQRNVGPLFSIVEDVMERFHFDPQSIWNMDITGITTVHKPNKVVAFIQLCCEDSTMVAKAVRMYDDYVTHPPVGALDEALD
ncbi:hypothetical protein DPEC_G00090640 [Dallia pectoralis]|uniref:Uncharacterized protein n=1 Tax=Dallia pectoralis TaxID=75939 RepID=A0ACC2H1Q0_DALPE|nr:hypothetical protein DPEC_G00090640 [Dallia pectoralis]